MKSRKFLLVLLAIALITGTATVVSGQIVQLSASSAKTDTVSLKEVAQNITATGSIHSQNEATLHFQTGGKVIYLPFKEGDAVTTGQTIAQLDTYALQRQLTQALNTYRSTRDTFDQTKDNTNNGVLLGSQRYSLEVTSRSGLTTGDQENSIINDMIKRIVDQNQANLDNSVINVELANYAVSLASLTAPFDGVITQEDIATPNINVTPATSFSIADPTAKVFRAQVASSDIDFISIGASAIIQLDGSDKKISGTVIKIFPQKLVLPSGQDVYEVDIQADSLNNASVFGQTGNVLIKSNNQTTALMVPTWAIVGHTSIWVQSGGTPKLKTIEVGKTHGDMTEVISGLSPEDVVIVSPQSVAERKYQFL